MSKPRNLNGIWVDCDGIPMNHKDARSECLSIFNAHPEFVDLMTIEEMLMEAGE